MRAEARKEADAAMAMAKPSDAIMAEMKMPLGAGSRKLSTMKPKKKILFKKKKKLSETKKSLFSATSSDYSSNLTVMKKEISEMLLLNGCDIKILSGDHGSPSTLFCTRYKCLVMNKVMTILSSDGKNNNDVGHNFQIEFRLFGVRVSPVSFYKAFTKYLEIRGYLKTIRNEVFANLFTTYVAQSMKWRERVVIKLLRCEATEAFHRRMDSWAGFVVLSVCLSFCLSKSNSVCQNRNCRP